MTVNEKRNKIIAYCSDRLCSECELDQRGCKGLLFSEMTDEDINSSYDAIFPPKNDIIEHPAHYNREGAMQSIDEMELIFGKEAVKWFCLCNAWKYRYRASAKNGEEDIKKSDWYIRKYKELTSNE